MKTLFYFILSVFLLIAGLITLKCLGYLQSVIDIITNIAISPTLWILWGAIIGHVLIGYEKNFPGLKPWLLRITGKENKVLFERIEFILLPIIAVMSGWAILHPDTVALGFSTGLTWNTTLVAFVNKKRK